MASLLVLQLVFALVGFLVYHQCFRKKPGPGLPPGPKPLPIIGNILDLPPEGVPEHQHWLKFKEAYGPISSITVLGQTLIILHDRQAAQELLEKQSLKTSSRPSQIFAGQLCGFGNFIANTDYGAILRKHRKFVHQQLGTKAAVTGRFGDIVDVESRRLLLRVLNEPKDLREHIKAESSAIILKLAYGYTIEPQAVDPLVALIERMMSNFSLASVPMSWLVDIIPALQYLPDGFPGTAFKETARQAADINHAVVDIPYSFVQRQMANGPHRTSYVSSLTQQYGQQQGKLNDDDEFAIKLTAADLYGGGADTTVSTITSFILAMLLFPEVQRKAQEELDAVVGDGLPTLDDHERLPYVMAVVQEAFRWFPIVPLSIPHTVDEEIIYGGYRIPKGAFLLPSIWWFLNDPQTYPDPSSFEPERYLEPRNEPDPKAASFGFGRRICPGRFLAQESLFITVARVLAVFNISKAVDEQGKEIEPKIEGTAGIISHVKDFPYSIKPRSARHAELIRSVEVDHPWEKGDACSLEGEARFIGGHKS